jgi:hypothetical protein
MAYGNHSLYNGTQFCFAHLFVSLQLGMNPRFEGQTRAQRQGDFTNNSKSTYKNLITFALESTHDCTMYLNKASCACYANLATHSTNLCWNSFHLKITQF